MPRQTSRLSASATSALAEVPGHEPADDSMSLDVPEQLLTPEASRSETSSNNEHASTEEKPAARRRSTRVVRASLRATEALESTPVKKINKDDAATSSSQAYVDDLAKAKRSRSSLRHSIAVMESSLKNRSALPIDDAIPDDHPIAPDTPVSKSSEEMHAEDMVTSLQQRALRKRVEKALATDGEFHKARATPKSDSRDSLRRSTRLSMVDRASGLLARANSVLGKRTRDLGTIGKDLGRRASLRPRKVEPKEEETPAPATSDPADPASKKRRVSEGDLSKLQSKDSTPPAEPVKTVPRKHKIWLTHGLYVGQEQTDSPPRQRKSKTSMKASGLQQRILPLPMFAAARQFNQGKDFKLPFHVFSPLPPGQPKPDEWRKTNKNVFVGDAANEWRANKKLELSTCMCEEETGCDENCQNRYMFYECDTGNCRLGPECGNRSFAELKRRTKAGGKYNIGVEVIKTADRGYGVRSNRTFEPNQIIVEYTGEIITQFECERRMRHVYKDNDCYYLMYFDQNMIIDATRGSIARFVNHSCEPNCRMEKWTVAGKPRMALFAGENGIMTGDELSYDYNFDPYSNKNVQQCRCGSEKCRGILGPRPKDKEARMKTAEEKKATGNSQATKKLTGTKRKLSKATEITASPQGKKRKLLTPKSIKAGVKKAISKATPARGKAAAQKNKASTTGQGKATTKKNVKLPTVKGAARLKAAVRGPRGKTPPAKATKVKTTQLKRPSAETKKQIATAAAKGSRSPARKAPTKAQSQAKSPRKPVARKAPSKSPVKAKVSPVKKQTAKSVSSPAKAKAATGKTLGGSVRNTAKNMVRSVKGTKK